MTRRGRLADTMIDEVCDWLDTIDAKFREDMDASLNRLRMPHPSLSWIPRPAPVSTPAADALDAFTEKLRREGAYFSGFGSLNGEPSWWTLKSELVHPPITKVNPNFFGILQ